MALCNEKIPYSNFHDMNLDWILKKVSELEEVVGSTGGTLEEIQQRVTEIENLLNEWQSGDIPESMAAAIRNYVTTHISQLVGDAIRFVTFEITHAGYFVAYIPSNWRDITFKTSEYDAHIPDFTEYGHLVLTY